MSVPGVIRKLNETLVNRIAAGEVIQRPANALKELLENSLDANCTKIQITLKKGGLKILQIQDNGTGIRREDLEILCERFTTSKLTRFEDLNAISTFGFRGEALASISHVAHVTVITKTAAEQCGYEAFYKDGKLTEPPKACAGNQGTLITVEDLFYNVSTRRMALKNPTEEHNRVVEVVSRYAIHNPQVEFILKQQGENLSEIRTSGGSTHVDNIKSIFGNSVARELLEIDAVDEGLKFKLHGYISNANYSTKKHIFVLFINNRLVDSPSVRKAVDSVYSLHLPKGSYPFIYINLELDPNTTDVNVHPTKHEVHFLHEDCVVEKVRQVVECRLNGANVSRVFQTHSKTSAIHNVATIPVITSTSDNNLVRTDSNSQKLETFFNPISFSQSAQSSPGSNDQSSDKRRIFKLKSILNLRKKIEDVEHTGLREMLGRMVFIGIIDKTKAVFQYNLGLYLCNTEIIAQEMFYQILVYEFGNIGKLEFTKCVSMVELCRIALDLPGVNCIEADGDKEVYANSIVDLLKSKAEMLEDYFSVTIDKDGNLQSVPLLLENYEPDMRGLPFYILQLGRAVDWDDEEKCFETFCRETAKFYSVIAIGTEPDSENNWKWTTEHVLYTTIRDCFVPPTRFVEDSPFVAIANIPDLYRVFERC